VAELMRRSRRRRAHRDGARPATGPASRGNVRAAPGRVGGRIPFTPRAKKSLQRSLRQALELKDNYIGLQHIALGLLAMDDGMVPVIVSALGASRASLRAALLDRHRKAG
jgi:ATP-dependent Clp protease ATP-binding subunit ClpC